jgi:hypothetical protein
MSSLGRVLRKYLAVCLSKFQGSEITYEDTTSESLVFTAALHHEAGVYGINASTPRRARCVLSLSGPLRVPISSSTAIAQDSYIDPDNGIQFWGTTDPVHGVTYGVTYGYTLPPLNAGYDEFIGEIVAPIEAKWVGASPAGGMLNNLLLVAWPNDGNVVFSARIARCVVGLTMKRSRTSVTQRSPAVATRSQGNISPSHSRAHPNSLLFTSVLEGPKITSLPSTKVNASHWKWVYRCQNCISESSSSNLPGGVHDSNSNIYSLGGSQWPSQSPHRRLRSFCVGILQCRCYHTLGSCVGFRSTY